MQLIYAFIQYLKGDLGLVGAMVTYVLTKKKNWKRSVHLKFKAAYSSYPSEAAGTTRPLEFRPYKHISVFGADWFVKSSQQKTLLVFLYAAFLPFCYLNIFLVMLRLSRHKISFYFRYQTFFHFNCLTIFFFLTIIN